MKQAIKRVAFGLGGFLAVLACAQPSSATLLTTDPGTGTTTVFTDAGFNTASPGPVTLDGFVWTGNPGVSYGNVQYGVGSNGFWSTSNDFSYIATDNQTGSITVNLGGDFGFVGGFMNYAPGIGSDPTITALAADGVTVLATYDLATLAPISTPGGTDAGAFRGISLGTDNIHFFELSGSYILAHTLEIGQLGAAVPEPGTLLLLGSGLAGLALIRRRRAAVTARLGC